MILQIFSPLWWNFLLLWSSAYKFCWTSPNYSGSFQCPLPSLFHMNIYVYQIYLLTCWGKEKRQNWLNILIDYMSTLAVPFHVPLRIMNEGDSFIYTCKSLFFKCSIRKINYSLWISGMVNNYLTTQPSHTSK